MKAKNIFGYGMAINILGHGKAINILGHGRAINILGHGRAINILTWKQLNRGQGIWGTGQLGGRAFLRQSNLRTGQLRPWGLLQAHETSW